MVKKDSLLKAGMPQLIIVIMLAVFAVSISACTQSLNGTNQGSTQSPGTNAQFENFNPKINVNAQSFNSTAEFETFLRQNTESAVAGGAGGIVLPMANDQMGPAKVAAVSSGSTTSESSGQAPQHSGTNVQVAGIDEGDTIKNDGKYIYTITGNTVFIVDAYPAQNGSVVSRITLNDTPQGLFIDGNKLAVFGTVGSSGIAEKLNFTPRNGLTFLKIYDVSDKNSPKLEKQFYYEGMYFDSRMIGSDIYVMTRSQPSWRPIYPMPVMIEGSTVKESAASSVLYYPIHYDNPQFVGINAVDLSSGKSETKTVVVDGSQNLYMSNDSVYLTYTKYINEYQIRNNATISIVTPMLPSGDQQLIQKINAVDPEVLSQSEKESKILGVVNNYLQYLTDSQRQKIEDSIAGRVKSEMKKYQYLEYTIISRIGVKGLDISVEGTGKVPGHINNQFSMDESNNVLRVATTVSQRYDYTTQKYENASNHVYALDSELNVIGSLDNISSGDTIYSTRFTQNRLYMVTYSNTDPFQVIDLSNPRNIRELGSLKISGFSRYLQPYDDNTIVGLGTETDSNGYQTGLKISMFDVSDVSKPKLLASYTSGDRYANSIAEFEHHAFLLSKEKNLLVIPVYSYRYVPYAVEGGATAGSSSGSTTASGSSGTAIAQTGQYTGYNGALVFNITKSGITLRGLIDHSQAVTGNSYGYSSPAVERSLYIGNVLYTKSPTLIRANSLSDLSSLANITLTAKQQLPFPIY